MGTCDHEEAYTRVLVHITHSLQTKCLGLLHSGDTVVFGILLANHYIVEANPAADIWINYHTGKSNTILNLKSLATNLGQMSYKCRAFFHGFT